jgi:benzoylformate decarboxylase
VAAVELVEKHHMAVLVAPPTGGGRIGFPECHEAFQGVLPPAVGPLGQALEGHDLVLVAGSSVFPYYPNIPGPFLPEGAELVAITCDPAEAARAPVGDTIVADVGLTLRALADALEENTEREPPAPRAPAETEAGAQADAQGTVMSPSLVHATLAELFPADAIIVLESPSSTAALRMGRGSARFYAGAAAASRLCESAAVSPAS